jgi:peptide/nickel transport system substrate-binding protein
MTFRFALCFALCLAPFAAQAERASDGQVKILYWQAPSILNPYLSGGTKDIEAASLALEPLARYDETGALVPWLAAHIPSLENGGISADLRRITWRLQDGLRWSDGTPVTSADVKFTYDYCTHPGGGCAQITKFEGVSGVDTPDAQTVVVRFDRPTPFPFGPFVGAESPILQAAQFADCLGAQAAQCTDANFAPIGTGPFTVTEFRPNDVITMAANPHYRDPGKPAFASLVLKGGGDAAGAARAVLETGEYDYAWNLQLAPEVITQMEARGKGTTVAGFGPLVERLMLNNTDPNPDLPPNLRSIQRPHPLLSDPAIRLAMSMAIDRALLVDIGYGKAGQITCNWVPAPAAVASDTFRCDTQDITGANALLDQANIIDTNGDGIREKNGQPLILRFQTATNPVRQDFQALIKAWWQEIGIETELRNINGSVFFGSDPASPDTYQKFYADVQMYANTFAGTDPQSYLGNGLCNKAPGPQTQWQGENIARFCDPKYDALHAELTQTAAPAKRAALARRLNDMAVSGGMMIPLVHRGRLSAHLHTLGGVKLNVWDSELWNAADWYRQN